MIEILLTEVAYVMVSSDGEPINHAVLEQVALPVTVPGKLVDYQPVEKLHHAET